MPSLHVRKRYFANAYYHVYNRGALGAEIFFDPSDYQVFRKIVRNTLKQMMGEVTIHAYVLMPNHFHFLLHQTTERAIIKFIQSLSIKYAMYLRRTYGHRGRLFEGPYKAIFLSSKRDIDRVYKYIADNPLTSNLHDWPHVGSNI